MRFGARGTGTRQTIWRTTVNLRYLMENRNQGVSFDWIELISVFSDSCWSNRLQSVIDTSCLYQKRGSKLKVRRTLLINHRKIIMWGHLPIVHKETHSVNNTCHSFPCSSLNSASLLVCVSQILLWIKSEFRKWSFSVWHITQTCFSQICFRELMKADIEGEMVWNGKTWKIFLSDLSSLLHC